MIQLEAYLGAVKLFELLPFENVTPAEWYALADACANKNQSHRLDWYPSSGETHITVQNDGIVVFVASAGHAQGGRLEAQLAAEDCGPAFEEAGRLTAECLEE